MTGSILERSDGATPPPSNSVQSSLEEAIVPETITITDDRTGKTVTVPIEGGVFPSSALRELDPSLYCYDPAFLSTASTQSSITYLDGTNGILRYGG